MPVNPIQITAPNQQLASFNEIERRRALAKQLAGTMPAGDIRSTEQGIAHVVGKVGEAYQNYKANRMEKDRTAALAQALGPKMQEMGLDPAVMSAFGGEEMARMYAQMAMEEARARRDAEAQANDPMRQAQIEELRSRTQERNNPLTKAERGLQPQYGVNSAGEPVILQLGKDGTAVQTQLPEGVQLSKEPIKLDAGTHFVLLDPITRQPVGSIPKNLGVAEQEKAMGKARGEAGAGMDAARLGVDETIRGIDELLTHPGLETSVGTVQGRIPDWAMGAYDSNVADFRSRVDQLRGKAFLEAYNGLRGGGQITEVEGKKAENALARLNMAVSEKDFRQALQDFRDAVETGYAKLASKAGQGMPAPAPQQGGSLDDLLKKYGGQ